MVGNGLSKPHQIKLLKKIFRVNIFIFIFISLIIYTVNAAVPLSLFNATPRSGMEPLAVSFSDLSKGHPTGLAWFFGDENFSEPWTEMNVSPGWAARWGQASVVMPDGNIVLMGGFIGNGQVVGSDRYTNDTWRSTDEGASWELMNTSPGWSIRGYENGVAMPDGKIILMGGYGPYGYFNDVWRSSDEGTTWDIVNASPGWSPRFGQSSVVMPDGTIVIMGGYGFYDFDNDVWKSSNEGATWMEVNASPGWSKRYSQSSIVTPDGDIILFGGYDSGKNYMNDVWRSTDEGATWTEENTSASWSPRHGQCSVMIPDGSIIMMGGRISTGGYKNDIWRSTDKGETWTQINESAGWPERAAFSCVAIPNGNIVLMGGYDLSSFKNDVWRVGTAGSFEENPIHIYNVPGIYQVSLVVYNSDGFNTLLKPEYISVTGFCDSCKADTYPAFSIAVIGSIVLVVSFVWWRKNR